MITIGQILKKERLKRKLSLTDVEIATKIKSSFLDAVEKGQYDKLPSSAYASGFVTSYAQFLDIPKSQAIGLFKREFDEKSAFKVLPKGFTNEKDFQLHRRRFSAPVFGISLVVIAILAYLFFQYRYAIINPPLSVYTPKDNSIITSQNIMVKGSTDPNATVVVNTQEVAVDDNGYFSTTIPVFPGTSVVHIVATNRFGKVSTVDRNITVK